MRTIVTTMRNEAPFILEWLAYHRAIGFTDFVIFSNDCDDGTDLMLDRLQQMGMVHHLPNTRRGKKPVQWTALNRAANHPAVKKADWIFVADVDEFLNIHAGDGHLDDLLAARPDADGFLLSWRMFGANGQIRFDDAPVMRQFTAAAPDRLIWPWRAVQFKTLYRNNDPARKLGVHAPDRRAETDIWVDDNGQTLGRVRGTVMLHKESRYGLAQVNHYALGSAESFLVKCDRGKPNHADQAIDLAYWLDRNFNEVEDTTILRHADATVAGVASLMADPVIAQLHAASVTWRKDRIAALMLQSDYFYLMARIIQSGPTKALSLANQQILLDRLYAMRHAQRQAKTAESPT
ncbi:MULTISPECIES: glycosyltransferase family 2 protein [unclassified Yoonia]|uniref:glycosyltransferase family 2 protein n=1 Tax=unclassified Yoonia TaxID=2629118 RepID=UPI002AFEA01A|nr:MULTISPECIES: glycosyltransferase family 2 protein [unclassified Yoonia]